MRVFIRARISMLAMRAQVASIDFAGAVIAGSLPSRALVLVVEWTALHCDELHANWERARREEPLEQIESLS